MKTINYTGSSKLISRIVNLLNRRAPLPLDGDGDPDWGTNGQVLSTDGAGNTAWVNQGGGGSGGHTIEDTSGTDLPQEDNLQFVGVYTRDDSVNSRTEVNIVRQMTKAAMEALPAAQKVGFIRTSDEPDNPYVSIDASQVHRGASDVDADLTALENGKVNRSGDIMTGGLTIAGGINYSEGIRLNTAPDGYFGATLGTDGTEGIRDGAFWVGGRNIGNPRCLFVGHNTATDSATYFHASSSSDKSPKLHVPSGSIASGDGDAVNGDAVYSYIASGKSNRDEHNANNALKNGFYYYTSNGPATSLGASSTDGALYVQQYSDAWVAQIAQDYRNGRLFVRGKNNGVWQSWQTVMLKSDVEVIPLTLSATTSWQTYSGSTTNIVKACSVNVTNSGVHYNFFYNCSHAGNKAFQLHYRCADGNATMYCEVIIFS